jgi:hypothetical protein
MIRSIWKTGRLIRGIDGSMTVEAAVLLPFVASLILLLASLIQLASAELALRSAVSETAKSIAGYWPPVRMVYADAKSRASSTQAGQWATDIRSRLESAHGQWSGSEDWIMQYEALLPEPVVDLLKWEIGKREELEDSALQNSGTAIRRVTDPILCRTFEPILHHYSNPRLLKKDKLKLELVRLPSLEPGGAPYVELIASYELKLPVPFWNKTVVLEKKSYERAWVGYE